MIAMKKIDILIYILLLAVGGILGWVLRIIVEPPLQISVEQPPIVIQKIANESALVTEVPTSVQPAVVSKNDSENDLSPLVSDSVKPISNLNAPKQIKSEFNYQESILQIKNQLERNEFYDVLQKLVQYRKMEGKEALVSEIKEMLEAYVSVKIGQKEGQTLLADIERILNSEQGCWPIIILKGKVYISLEQYEEGAESLKKEMFYVKDEAEVKELQSFIRLLRAKRIEQLQKQKLTERLVQYYEGLILEDSSYAPYYFELAKLYITRYQYDNALVLLRLIVLDQTYGKEAEALILKVQHVQELEAQKQRVQWQNEAALEIPIVKKDSHYFVNCALDDKLTVRLMIDTGANMTIISEAIAVKLGINLQEQKDLRWFHTAGGMVKQPVIRLKRLTIQSLQIVDIVVGVNKELGNSFDGLLGMNFFNYFNFEIDQEKKILVLRQK